MSERPSGRFRILLIEDSLEESLLVQALVEGEGLGEVRTVQDGLAGARLAQDDAFDLILCDLNLPGFDGVGVIDAAKRARPDRPVIVTTGYDDPVLHERALARGADRIFVKPVDRSAFLAALWELLAAGSGPGAGLPRRQTKTEAAQTVLAVSAFPGDVLLGCGGILSGHVAEGWVVVMLCLSRRFGPRADLADAAREAADRLGAHLVFGDVPPEEHDRAVALIRSLIDLHQPHTVLTPSPHDRDPARVAAHDAVVEATPATCHVYAYHTATSGVAFRPTLYASVQQQMDAKLRLLEPFADYDEELSHLTEAHVRATARYWGRHSRHVDVEPLELIWTPTLSPAGSAAGHTR